MKINKSNLSFGSMSIRSKTKKLVLHHAAASKCSVDDVHRWHKNNGWSGIGYHFFVRKDGSIWEGRPLKYVGAHAYGNNSDSIGVCFEGNFENEKMPDVQKEAGKELVSYILKEYPTITSVVRHKDLAATACPGKNFPFAEIKKGKTSAATTPTTTKKAFPGVFPVLPSRGYFKKGDEGVQVRRLQIFLNWCIGANLDVDGDLGKKTYAAVKSFQKIYGLDADGLFGIKSLAKAKTIEK